MAMEQNGRTEARSRVLRWVERAPMCNAYLLDFFDRGARICRDAEDGLVLFDAEINLCYAAGSDVDCAETRGALLVLMGDKQVAERQIADGCHAEMLPCRQAIYTGKEPVFVEHPGIQIQWLTEADIPFILENYHNPGAYESHIRGRIAEGMVGGFADGQMAGFAGVHQEGSVGLLEVMPQYRRRGIAEVLEAEIINSQLKKGRVPYCHVMIGNDASVALQEKLGLVFDEQLLYWLV